MKQKINILIAERNSHVRAFLKRELVEAGYIVNLAENGAEMTRMLKNDNKPHLLLIDPDMPDMEIPAILRVINENFSEVPVVVHTFPADYSEIGGLLKDAVFVEKQGNSIEKIKQILYDRFNQPVPVQSIILRESGNNSDPA